MASMIYQVLQLKWTKANFIQLIFVHFNLEIDINKKD